MLWRAVAAIMRSTAPAAPIRRVPMKTLRLGNTAQVILSRAQRIALSTRKIQQQNSPAELLYIIQ